MLYLIESVHCLAVLFYLLLLDFSIDMHDKIVAHNVEHYYDHMAK